MSRKREQGLSPKEAMELLEKCDSAIQSASQTLEEARVLAERAGLSVDSSCLDPTFRPTHLQDANAFVLRTTGGHSNTDHVVKLTGDYRVDRMAELKRALQRRARNMQPEIKGEDRWDKPRIPGERRRRILREKDRPEAPNEPPPSGYVIFVGQMTTKFRHDRPNERHNQTKAVREISRAWNCSLTEEDREYYNDFAKEARIEYLQQHREFRATGHFTPSTKFHKLDGVGPWIHSRWHDMNSLEREISTYDTVKFPPRPPEFDEAYRKREEESKRRRREKERKKDYERRRAPSRSQKSSKR